MARSAYVKDIARSIKSSIGRFVAIALIAALGTGFYSGLRMTGPDMQLAADEYYDATNASDIRVVSTLGFDEQSIAELVEIEGVEEVVGEYEVDVLATIDNVQYSIRIHGLDLEAATASDTSDGINAISDDASYINRPILVEGSWPTNDNEIVLSADAILETEISVGDKVYISETSQDSDTSEIFNQTEYTITGFVRSSYYVNSSSLGSTSLGDGSIDDFGYISNTAFAEDYPYTGAFITVEGAREELAMSDAYTAIVDIVAERIEEASSDIAQARLERIKAEAQETLDDNSAQYESEKADVLAQLDDAQAQLESSYATLQDAITTITAEQQTLENARQTLLDSQDELDAGWQEYNDALTQFNSQKETTYAELDAAQAQLDAYASTIEPDNLMGQAVIAAMQADIDSNRQIAEQQFDLYQTELDNTLATLNASQAQIDSGWQQYYDGKQQLDEAMAEYEDGLKQYYEGLAEFETLKSEAYAELQEAEQQLVDAQNEIDDISMPDIYVLDNTKNVGMETYNSDSQRVAQIAQVFPSVFFLVAALVSLTTMTRMVDEERILIGTYKALGYSNIAIISKYLIYAFLASGIGSLVGIIVLTKLLPLLIMHAYTVIYILPATPTPIDTGLAILSAGIGIGITLIATWWSASSSLSVRPAFLMLPRVPKAGQRILLEYVTPIWKKMSFSWKVTARNIFRYKKRFFMAIIGIAGCTALLITGFGLQDSINDIIDKQYENDDAISDFNVTITLDNDIEQDQIEELLATIADDDRVLEYMPMQSENMVVSTENEGDTRVNVEVPQNPEEFLNYIHMRNRITKEQIQLDDSGVVISEKLANKYGISIGDTIELYEEDTVGNAIGSPIEFTVSGIIENYVDHYIYITPTTYETVTGEQVEYRTIMAKTTSSSEDRADLSNNLLAYDGVNTVSYVDEAIEYYRTALASVDSVVFILIVAAAALAFIVLYNLININIAERQREIATLKVLGFKSLEYTIYIFREIIILSILGAIIGLVIGIFLEGFVVSTAEVDMVMFGRDIHITSFIYSFLLTMAFTVLITVCMKYKLDRISMVESLKSVD